MNVTVGELMSAPAITVTPEMSIADLRKRFAEHAVNAFPVVSEVGAPLGLVSQLDLLRVYLLPYRQFIVATEATWALSVGAIMTRGVVTLYPKEPAIRAMALMVEHGIRTIPVVEDAVAGLMVIGVITRQDLSVVLTD